jgi:hypothetical protein
VNRADGLRRFTSMASALFTSGTLDPLLEFLNVRDAVPASPCDRSRAPSPARARAEPRSPAAAMSELRPVRSVAATQLRALADRLAPLSSGPAPRSSAPLIRLGGCWWYRGDLVGPALSPEEVAADVQLRP